MRPGPSGNKIRAAFRKFRTHHPFRDLVLGVIALLLICVGYVFLSYEFRSLPGAKSVSSVVNEFKGNKSGAGQSGVLYQPPAQGVYTLRGQGSERISFPPNSMEDGAVMPATVTYLSRGCWRWHLDYNTAHWEEYDFCPTANSLLQTGNRNYQAWDFGTMKVTNLATFICPSNATVLLGDSASGESLRWVCTGSNTSVQGKTRAAVAIHSYGDVTLSIGRARVTAVHQLEKTTLSGGQNGTVLENWWYSATSGLPLRMTRQIKILTASPVGTITYTESGSWQMASITPRS